MRCVKYLFTEDMVCCWGQGIYPGWGVLNVVRKWVMFFNVWNIVFKVFNVLKFFFFFVLDFFMFLMFLIFLEDMVCSWAVWAGEGDQVRAGEPRALRRDSQTNSGTMPFPFGYRTTYLSNALSKVRSVLGT